MYANKLLQIKILNMVIPILMYFLTLTHQMSCIVRKPAFCICKNKDADQLRCNRKADQRCCFRYTIVQCLYFLNQKFHASRHLLWLYSPVCVGPGWKPWRPVFSQRGSNIAVFCTKCKLRQRRKTQTDQLQATLLMVSCFPQYIVE